MNGGRRKVRYGVAMSLDGFIAGPNGEYDWIVKDEEADAHLVEVWGRFGTLLMGRRTYEVGKPMFTPENLGDRTVVVASRTLRPEDEPGVTVVRELDRAEMMRLREQDGRDIWLMGGAELFRHLLLMGEVDGVDASVVPVLLGGGVPLLPAVAQRTELVLTSHRVFGSGIVSLSYDLVKG
ncbi:MAG TPA: dihydrofolate reductase family protein [Acidobacteriaceae bacterium]|nr:dihydrofolate reductase family protein [Acidobacteriaceae bacterium]